MKLFVAKLNRDVQDEDLVELFSQYGEVAYARVVTDRDSGQSKCFGFVQMRDSDGGRKAIDALNGNEFMRFNMVVKEAEERPRGERPASGGAASSSRPSTGRIPAPSSGGGLRSDRAAGPGEFSRHERPENATPKPATSPPRKSDKKPNRDIYQDGPRQPKMKRDRPKNPDWLEGLDDEIDD